MFLFVVRHGEYWCEPRHELAAAAPKAILPDELEENGWLHQTPNNQAFIGRCVWSPIRLPNGQILSCCRRWMLRFTV